MRSVSPYIARVLVVCAPLLLGGIAGCSTTQEKAAQQQAQSERILEAREQRQKKSKSHDHGGRKR